MKAPRHEATEALRRRLADGEDLRWLGRPHWRRMLFDLPRVAIPVLVGLGMVGAFVGFNAALLAEFYGIDIGPIGSIVAGVVLLVVAGVFGGLYALARRMYAHAEYAATDDRLIKFSGTFGRDYSTVDWESVKDLEVAVDALDRLHDTGTVHAVTAGRGGVTLRYVPDPYELVSDLEAIRTEGGDG